ncbi:Uncharacterised protein [Nocardia otitidiscaviarum]|uniref:Uncharacterized protein n=1 Tax=Nocardia otitidiscaviarum TaxID=1823 RepID=A0A379JGY1_9NOCA|nr:Uncharacterised protein [Nocardia otitidiscaviarum]
MGRFMFGLADLLREFRPFDFGIFAHPCFAEHCQQDHSPSGCEPIGDSDGRAVNRWAQLTDPVAEISGVWLTERFGLLCE